MLNAFGNINNGHLPSKFIIGSRNPPFSFSANSAHHREDPPNPRSIISQTEFAKIIIPVPSVS